MNIRAMIAAAIIGIFPAMPAVAQDPYVLKDNTQITISGTVASVERNSFVLDYGGGSITVDLGGWGWLPFGKSSKADEQLKQGDTVVVYGEVDDELFERTKIKADHVYVQELGTQFSPGPGSQQAGQLQQPAQFFAATWTFVNFDTVVEGTVTSVSREKNQFELRTGTTSTQTLVVDTNNLQNNPLDQEGFQQLKEGDRVAVSANFDSNFIENRRLIATNVVSMNQEGSKQDRRSSGAAVQTTGTLGREGTAGTTTTQAGTGSINRTTGTQQ